MTAVARAWRHGERARPLGRGARARTLGRGARARRARDAAPAGGDLTVVVAPTSVERLQLVCANAARDGACLLLLNPRLALPSPVAAGATMAPLLLSDFERIYEASADALRVAGPGDHGVALHRRWPDKRYRLFARDGDRFDFVGNSARRPGADQLRAIYAETTRHRVYDGSEDAACVESPGPCAGEPRGPGPRRRRRVGGREPGRRLHGADAREAEQRHGDEGDADEEADGGVGRQADAGRRGRRVREAAPRREAPRGRRAGAGFACGKSTSEPGSATRLVSTLPPTASRTTPFDVRTGPRPRRRRRRTCPRRAPPPRRARQGRVQLPERRRGGVDDDGRGAARERGRGVEQTNGTARNADAALSLVKGEFDRRARGDERGERGRAAGGGRAGDGGGGRAGRREEDGYGRAPREDRLAQRRGSGLRARRQEVRPPG